MRAHRRKALLTGILMVAATAGVVVAPASPARAATGPSRPIVIAGTTWSVRDALTGPATTTFSYGNPGDVPISGDWDGDGTETPGVVRGRTWYLRNSLSAGPPDVTFTYGRSSDAIVVGDWDGNGTDTPGIVRSNTWHLRNSNTSGGGEVSFIYGATYDIPLAGDWDGNGTTTPGAIRGNTWILRNSNSAGQGDLRFIYGAVTDLKVAGDWDGNGTATVGAVRDGQWILRNTNTPGGGDVIFSYGSASDLPLSTTQAFARDRGGRPLSSSRRGNHMTALPTTAKVVALTFDAGANNNGVAAILSTLAAQGVPATFFMTGAFTRSFPNDARTIGLRYPVGNHSDTHPDFRTLTDAQIRTQLSTAQTAIVNSARYDPRPLFRFPYGGSDTRTLNAVNGAGYASIWWTVDTLGWQGTSGGQSASTVVTRVVNALRPGEIILMHMGSNPTDGSTLDADALPAIISELRARGYTFTTLVPYL